VQQPLDPQATPARGADSRYSERLWPSPGIWVVSVGFGALLGLIPAPIDADLALWTSIVGVVVIITAMLVSTPVISLDDEWFQAGRARIRREFLAGVEALDTEDMRAARGRRLDARAYLCIRGWLPRGVKVLLRDPADPTPYWLVSSRRPDALAAALRS